MRDPSTFPTSPLFSVACRIVDAKTNTDLEGPEQLGQKGTILKVKLEKPLGAQCHSGHDSYIVVEVQVWWDFQLVFLVNC